MAQQWRVGAVGFHHGHIGEQLGFMLKRPDTALVGVFHPEPDRMNTVCDELGIAVELRHTDFEAFLESDPQIVVVCSPTTEHADWVERLAERGIHILIEKPFATTVADARRMVSAQARAGVTLVVNWPLAYYPVHRTARRLIAEGALGGIRELHYYDGNRGPQTWLDPARDLSESDRWWFDPEAGGGALHDYLGYGATLATWFLDGQLPLDVSATSFSPPGLAVDTHTVVTARYDWGLATFQARWGTITNPWMEQGMPLTGFVIVGTEAALISTDYAPSVRVHDPEHPSGYDVPVEPWASDHTALAELLASLATAEPVTGPASLATSLAGQQIVEAAVQSAATARVVAL